MGKILYVSHDAKNNSVTLQGRNMDGTYPANGYLVASTDPGGQNYVRFTLPGSVVLEKMVDYKDIKDATTLVNLGNPADTVTSLNEDYLSVDSTIDSFDDVEYDSTSMNNTDVLRWDNNTWAAHTLTSSDVSALPQDAELDDLADVDVGSATDGQVLTWIDADQEWQPTTVSSGGGGGGASDIDDLGDVDTTGVADGDGLRYDGTDFVAGKWGVGTENQVVPANENSGSTTRTVKLDTQTNFPTQVSSTTTLDVVDAAGNILESVRSLEINVGAGPTYIATQNKYGILTNKKDASGNIGKIGFNNQYADGGNNMYLQCDNITAAYSLNLPPAGSTTDGQVLSVASSSTSSQTDLEWVTPSSGGGGGSVYTFTDTGRRQWSSAQDNYYHVGDSGFGMNDTSKNYALFSLSGTGQADVLMFNGWVMPAAVTTLSISGHCNTFSNNVYGEDLDLMLVKITYTSGDDCTLTTLDTQTVTLGSASGDISTFNSGDITVSLAQNEVVLPVFRFPNATMSSTCYLRYGLTMTAS